jgi:hypothetical protein
MYACLVNETTSVAIKKLNNIANPTKIFLLNYKFTKILIFLNLDQLLELYFYGFFICHFIIILCLCIDLLGHSKVIFYVVFHVFDIIVKVILSLCLLNVLLEVIKLCQMVRLYILLFFSFFNFILN